MAIKVHVVYLAQLLGVVLFIHFISNQDKWILKSLFLFLHAVIMKRWTRLHVAEQLGKQITKF